MESPPPATRAFKRLARARRAPKGVGVLYYHAMPPRPSLALLLERLWIVYSVFVAGFAAYAVHLSATERIRGFYADDWVQHAVRVSKPFLAYLFTSHNGHLIPATKLILYADYEVLGGDGALPYGFALAFVGLSLTMLLSFVRNGDSADLSLRRTLAGFLCFCLLWAATHYGLLWGFSVHAPMTVLALLGALLSLIVFAVRPEAQRRSSLVVLAGIAAFFATLTCSTGVVAWGSLIAVALVARLPVPVTAFLTAGAGLSVSILALVPMGEMSALDIARSTLSEPTNFLKFTLSFLGGPVGYVAESVLSFSPRSRDVVSLWAGGLGLTAFVVYAIRRLQRFEDPDRLGLFSIALMTFGVGAALLTALGRAWLPGYAYRFTLWSILFWMGGASAMVSMVERGRLSHLRAPLLVGLPCISLLMLPALDTFMESHRYMLRANLQHNLMALVGIRSQDHLPFGYGASETVPMLLPIFERDGRGPFADPRRSLLGQELNELGPVAETGRCSGRLGRPDAFRDGAGITARVKGSVHDGGSPHPPLYIVITNRAGVVRGLGNVKPRSADQRVSWYAYTVPDKPQSYVAHAALEDGTFCRLGGFDVSEPATIDASRDGAARPERLD